MNYTFKGPGAGPFPYRAQLDTDLICVVGTAEGDVTLKPNEYEVKKNTTRPGAVVTLASPLPDGCYLTIGTEDVKTPDNIKPTGNLKAANPEAEKPETVEEQGYAIIRFDGDVDGNFDTTPGEKVIQLKVNAAAFAAKAEYAESALSSNTAGAAKKAQQADEANHAGSADKAKFADASSQADRAEQAKKADYAINSGHANSADLAEETNRAAYAETAGYASEALKARQACQANIATVATTAWEAERLVNGVTVNEAVKAQSADIADRANQAYASTRATLADQANFAYKAEDAYYSETANVANYARRDCKGNLIYDTYLRKDEAENIYVSIDEFANQLEILEDEKADRTELLKTANVGGKANGYGVVVGTNLELTITDISGLMVGDDGELLPITDPSQWFEWVTNVNEIVDPTNGYCLLNNDAVTFPISTTQFYWDTALPAVLNAANIYCVYTRDAVLEEEKLVRWAHSWNEDLDKTVIWNIYDDGTTSQTLPKNKIYRVVYDPVTGWCLLGGNSSAQVDNLQQTVDALRDEVASLQNTDEQVEQNQADIAELKGEVAYLTELLKELSGLGDTANAQGLVFFDKTFNSSNISNSLLYAVMADADEPWPGQWDESKTPPQSLLPVYKFFDFDDELNLDNLTVQRGMALPAGDYTIGKTDIDTPSAWLTIQRYLDFQNEFNPGSISPVKWFICPAA